MKNLSSEGLKGKRLKTCWIVALAVRHRTLMSLPFSIFHLLVLGRIQLKDLLIQTVWSRVLQDFRGRNSS